MIKKNLLLGLSISLTTSVFSQFSKEKMDSINKLNNQDHQLMMKLLGISDLRPGPSGNPKDVNAANSDESKANPFTSLPDPLVFKNGNKVNTPQ